MHVLALIAAIVAVLVFVVEYGRSKSLVAAGLAVLTVAWIVATVVQTGDGVVID